MRRIVFTLLVLSPALVSAQLWTVRVEEPTGLYRRTGEILRVPLARFGGHTTGFTVAGPDGKELKWQVSGGTLLFPVSIVPGQTPEYRVYCCDARPAPKFENEIVVTRIGMKRVELANSRFRAVIDLGVPAIVEAYSLSAGPQRMLNMVETSPESSAGMKGDIHSSQFKPAEPVPGVEGENLGWTAFGGKGPMTGVELIETGPLLGRLRLTREGEAWEFVWTAGSPALEWKARGGFRFLSVSAAPYLPFDRCVDGSEYNWPTGPEPGEPSPNRVAPRPWAKPPGGHFVYYQRAEDYGALGIVALDPALQWKGACSRRFQAESSAGETSIALSFPKWRGAETVLEARREYRVLKQPLIASVTGPVENAVPKLAAAAREQTYRVEIAASAPATFAPDHVSLDGEWDLAWSEKGAGPPKDGWRSVKVPGTVHPQWLDPSKLYTRDAEWISYKEWWYRRTVNAPERFRGKRLQLEFEATDYYADVYLNGQFAGRHEGYIDPWHLDVTRLLKPGASNELLVRVWTPVHYYWKHRPYTVKGSYGAVDQKPDDITALGITRSLRLAAYEGSTIRDLAVATRLTGANGAEVEISLDAEGAHGGNTWELTLSPRNFTGAATYRTRVSARGSSRIVIPVKDPQLWWTWDHGKPNLYTLNARLLNAAGKTIDARSLAVGIREIEKIGWDFYLNRKRLFIRGTNYYYNLFLSEMNRSKYERDMDLMLSMNVNMIRIHCHFSSPEFYDLADERGVLIWQDFLEAWYPHDTAFSLAAAALYDNHIRYVRNHPSIALWATSDEEDLENYRDVTKHLAPRASFLDPERRAVVRSTGRYGDSHVYHGWYGGSIWEYTKMDEAFVSELGATSLPNYETLVKFMGDKWPIRDHAEEWTWRRLQIGEAMRAWGNPGGMSMKDYIPRTQMYVARLFQIALERMRQRKSTGAGGILHFHAIDIWPSVTMAAIDIERVPTKVFDVVRRSFEPVAASFEYQRDKWKSGEEFRCGLWAINDHWSEVPGATVRWRVADSQGATAARGEWPAAMPPDSATRLGDVYWKASSPGAWALRAEVIDAQGKQISENVFEFEVTP